MVTPAEYLRLAVDPLRLAVLGAASAGSVDVAALRRHLVDEGLPTRADGSYRRTGGRFEAS